MNKQTKIILTSILFLAVAIVDIYAVITKNKTLEFIFKPLLITSLTVVCLVSVKKTSFWLLLALFFSFWGDVFLLDKTNFFVFGLASFLLVHTIYIKITLDFLQKILTSKIITSAIPFIILFGGLFHLIYPKLGDMLFPVIIYGVTISTFGSIALLNYRQEKNINNLWLLIGVVLFITSDSLIALNNFCQQKEIFDILIIILYAVSQYFICKSILKKQLDI